MKENYENIWAKMNEVIVEYDYVAKESDELTIKKGDIIKDVVRKSGGWWEGVLKDKKGMFPDNFVRSMDKDYVILRNTKDVARIKKCRVVFSYNQDHEDELNLKVGDIIDIIGEEEEGWWRGTLNGKEGVFPSNFVKEVPWQPNPSNRTVGNNLENENDKPPQLPLKPTKQFCEATFPYKGQNEDELSFKEGDIITLLNKDSQDPGWWQGELHGKIGVFPDNFVVLISNNSDSKGSGKDDRKTLTRVLPETGVSVASQRKSLETRVEKIERSDSDTSVSIKTPPIPSKKPVVSLKKSPSGAGNFISEIKKKIVDVVDGTTGSKNVKGDISDNVDDNAFDQVERRPLLSDVRATRAKAPGRRLPTSNPHKDELPEISNGSVIVEMESPEQQDVKPRLREWEKHKAPWLEEMKQNQVRRTMIVPVEEHPPENENKPIKIDNNAESIKSLSPQNQKLRASAEPERPERPNKHSISQIAAKEIPKDVPLVTSQRAVTPTKMPSSGLTYVLERLEMLEEAVRKQNEVIEDLRNRLQIEIDMRVMLQDKNAQNVLV